MGNSSQSNNKNNEKGGNEDIVEKLERNFQSPAVSDAVDKKPKKPITHYKPAPMAPVRGSVYGIYTGR